MAADRVRTAGGARLSAVLDMTESSGTSPAVSRGVAKASLAPPVERGVNEVRLVGRLGVGLREMTMPSGDTVVSFHLVVARPPRSARQQERRPREPTVDTLACAAWSAKCRRAVSTAASGDLLEVEGALRRRFRRSAGGPVSFYEVEVSAVRRAKATPT